MSAVLERRTYRDYSPEFKAEVLAAVEGNDGNVLRTANHYDIGESTIREWISQSDRYRNFRDQKLLDLASKSESNAHLLADSIASHDLDSASLAQKATAYGIMVDKMQLLRGQPTSISQSADRSGLSDVLESMLNCIDVTPETEP